MRLSDKEIENLKLISEKTNEIVFKCVEDSMDIDLTMSDSVVDLIKNMIKNLKVNNEA